MIDLEPVRRATEVDWTDERARRVERKMQARLRRRRVARAALAVAAIAAAAIAIVARPHPRHDEVVRVVPPAAPTIFDRSADLVLDEATRPATLARGEARFVTDSLALRCGVVEVKSASLADVTVAREGEGARVRVAKGTVLLAWVIHGETASVELRDGQEGVFPPPAPPVVASTTPSVARPTPPSTWRALAKSGDFERAYAALHGEGPAAVRDEPEDLFLAADAARLSHHAEDAVAPLRKLVERHPSDSRAPLAAFTLGRVELDDLGHPREAAAAFAKTRALAPSGPLAEDALAREVESWSRADEGALAKDRAREYVRAYPEGRRRAAVEKFGGL